MKTSIVVPCYNEVDNIAMMAEAFVSLYETFQIELILVDNGSFDGTGEKIDLVCDKYAWVKKVTVQKNCGYGNGILTGLAAASGDFLGWIHADLQSEPGVFAKMIRKALTEQGDFLYKGRRLNRSNVDLVFTEGMGFLESMYFQQKLVDINSQPTLLSRGFYETWENPPKDFSLDLYVYVLAKKRQIPIRRCPSPQHKRYSGDSTWNTGVLSRINMVKRVVDYSKAVKQLLEDEAVHGK